MPTDESLSNESNRRAFLKTAGAATATANATLSGCVGGFTGSSGGGSLADASPADEITFIAEDLAATVGFRNFTSQFEEEFRIGVTVDLAPYSEMVEQINQQFAAGSGEYAAIYSDPYANVAAFPDKHVNLDQFIGNDEFESVPNGFVISSKRTSQRTPSSQRGRRRLQRQGVGPVKTLPYDASTLMMAYRTDVFDNQEYSSEFEKNHDYPFQPGPERTWDQVIEMSAWVNENVPDDVVPWGYGGAGQQHDALQLDFNTFL